MKRSLLQALCVCLLTAITMGCGDSNGDDLQQVSGQQGNAGTGGNTQVTVSVNPTTLTLSPGSTSAPLIFSETTNGQSRTISAGEFTFVSSDPTVATVDNSGIITVADDAVAGDTAVITGTRGTSNVTTTTTVTVANAGAATGLTSQQTAYQLPAGSSSQPVAVRGTSANGSSSAVNNQDLDFISSDTAVATVDANGVITVAPGATNGQTAIITATDANGETYDFDVVVGNVVTDRVVFSPATVVVNQGGTASYTVTRYDSSGAQTDISNSPNLTFTNAGNATGASFTNGSASGGTAGSGTGTLTYDDNGTDFTTGYSYTVR